MNTVRTGFSTHHRLRRKREFLGEYARIFDRVADSFFLRYIPVVHHDNVLPNPVGCVGYLYPAHADMTEGHQPRSDARILKSRCTITRQIQFVPARQFDALDCDYLYVSGYKRQTHVYPFLRSLARTSMSSLPRMLSPSPACRGQLHTPQNVSCQ